MRTRSRLVAAAVAGTMLLAACGGGGNDADSGAQSGEALPTVDAESGSPAPVAQGEAFVDLLGAEVIPAANIPTNLLPDVVIDDLTNGRKVNFRNLVPQEKPILLWMYAPH